MKTKKYKQFFAVIFLIMLIGFSTYNIVTEHGSVIYDIKEIELPENIEQLHEVTGAIDGILSDNLVGGYQWNELYGAVHKVLGKNEENSFKYVRDKNGFLYSGNFWNTSNVEPRELALRVRRLQDAVADKNTKVVCITYPVKYNEEWSNGYYGIPYNDLNKHADSVLMYMRRYNVDYLDFREVFLEANMTMEDLFYKTDHHWNTPTAFYATGILQDYIENKYGDDWDPQDYYTDINNYVVETHKNMYLGSQGRDAGVVYSGLDDYTFIYPKFDTYYTHNYLQNEERFTDEGDTLETLISKKYLEYEDIYRREMYNSYLRGVCLENEIVNHKMESGPKVLFLRDSYTSPLAVFLAPMCKEIDLIWSSYYDAQTVEELIAQEEYDYIFVALAADDLMDERLPFFIEDTKDKQE